MPIFLKEQIMNKLLVILSVAFVLLMWVMQQDTNNALERCNGDTYCELNVLKGV